LRYTQRRFPRALNPVGIHLSFALGLSNEVGPPQSIGGAKACNAIAVTGPTPGIVISRAVSSHSRALVRSSRSSPSIFSSSSSIRPSSSRPSSATASGRPQFPPSRGSCSAACDRRGCAHAAPTPSPLLARCIPSSTFDNIRRPGGLSALFQVPLSEVRQMEFIGPGDATTRWGTGPSVRGDPDRHRLLTGHPARAPRPQKRKPGGEAIAVRLRFLFPRELDPRDRPLPRRSSKLVT
jgi:hypothetical protein